MVTVTSKAIIINKVPFVSSLRRDYENYLKQNWARFFLYEDDEEGKLFPLTLMEFAQTVTKPYFNGSRIVSPINYRINQRKYVNTNILHLSICERNVRKKILGR